MLDPRLYCSSVKISAQEIRRLTDLWYQTIGASGLNFAEAEQYRLHANGVAFHELDYDGVHAACVGLTKQVLTPGHNSFIDFDHYLLWSWLSELIIGPGGPLSFTSDSEIYLLAQTVANAALAKANAYERPREAWARQERERELLNPHSKYLIEQSLVVLAYLSFPFLETVVRRACSEYVTLTGKVEKSFERKNNSKPYPVGSNCNSVGDMLRLLRDHVAGQDLKSGLNEIFSHIEEITGEEDGCSLIYRWRNSSLHGETTHRTIGGTVYGLALMIALSEIEDRYAQERDMRIPLLQMGRGTYYPPS